MIDTLERFKDFEIQNKVFLHCDAGNYRKLLDRNGKAKASQNVHSSREASSSSASSSSSTLASVVPKLSLDDAASSQNDLLKSRLFAGERYIDGGLVLPTQSTMELVTAFTMEASQWSHFGNLKTSNEKNKGGRRTNPSNTGRLLVQLARDNRLYELSFRVLNRVCELDRRFVNLATVKEGNRQHLDSYWETLQRLLQYVNCPSPYNGQY
jgi:hypothetical protein